MVYANFYIVNAFLCLRAILIHLLR